MSVQKLLAVVFGCVAMSAMAGYGELVIAERGKGIASVELPDTHFKFGYLEAISEVFK